MKNGKCSNAFYTLLEDKEEMKLKSDIRPEFQSNASIASLCELMFRMRIMMEQRINRYLFFVLLHCPRISPMLATAASRLAVHLHRLTASGNSSVTCSKVSKSYGHFSCGLLNRFMCSAFDINLMSFNYPLHYNVNDLLKNILRKEVTILLKHIPAQIITRIESFNTRLLKYPFRTNNIQATG